MGQGLLVSPPPLRPVKILFLAANPTDTDHLRLDEEVKAITEALREAGYRDLFGLNQHWAVRVSELTRLLMRYQPDVVHFSGHGSSKGEIFLEDTTGRKRTVPAAALTGLFAVLKDNIRCVVLNACYTATQAEAIAKHIDCVIGMSRAISDEAAIQFAAAFYSALGYGRDLQTAFDVGRLEIDLGDLNEEDTPQIIAPNTDPKSIHLLEAPRIISPQIADQLPQSAYQVTNTTYSGGPLVSTARGTWGEQPRFELAFGDLTFKGQDLEALTRALPLFENVIKHEKGVGK